MWRLPYNWAGHWSAGKKRKESREGGGKGSGGEGWGLTHDIFIWSPSQKVNRRGKGWGRYMREWTNFCLQSSPGEHLLSSLPLPHRSPSKYNLCPPQPPFLTPLNPTSLYPQNTTTSQYLPLALPEHHTHAQVCSRCFVLSDGGHGGRGGVRGRTSNETKKKKKDTSFHASVEQAHVRVRGWLALFLLVFIIIVVVIPHPANRLPWHHTSSPHHHLSGSNLQPLTKKNHQFALLKL